MDFKGNFVDVLDVLYKQSPFMDEAKKYNFSGQEFATFLTQVAQMSINAALALEEAKLKERNFEFETDLRNRQFEADVGFKEREVKVVEDKAKLEKEVAEFDMGLKERGFDLEVFTKRKQLDFQEREIGLGEEKARTEIEIASSNAKIALENAKAENLKSLIQAESINRSVGDNASINKANAYVGFLNVMANAAELATAEKHAVNVISVINEINTKDIEHYNDLFNQLRKDFASGVDVKEVWVHSTKSVVEVGEKIKIMGFSVFDKECSFVVNGKTYNNTKTIIFEATKAGVFDVKFQAKNNEGQWVSDSTQIAVTTKTTF